MIVVPELALVGDTPDFAPSRRADGWSVATQREFCVAIAAGATVEAAARAQGLSATSAYAFRTTRAGAAFAAGWAAAQLAWRQHLSDLLVSRIVDGQTVTITMPDGSTRARHYFDNRLAMGMLRRLDALAAPPRAPPTEEALALRVHAQQRAAANSDDVGREIVHALDHYFAALEAAPDSDPRALAAAARGAETGCGSQHSQHSPSREDDDAPDEGIWWCDSSETWMTNFPPPEDADEVNDDDCYGSSDYARTLTGQEREAVAHWPTGADAAQQSLERARDARATFFRRATGFTPSAELVAPGELLCLTAAPATGRDAGPGQSGDITL